MTHFTPLHKIFILDAHLEEVVDEHNLKEFGKTFFQALMRVTKTKPLAPFSIFHATDPRAPGFSGVQPLTTSHTSFHYFWEPQTPGENPNVHLDFYSCSPFRYEDVLRIADEYFHLGSWTATLINRSTDPRARTIVELRGEGAIGYTASAVPLWETLPTAARPS